MVRTLTIGLLALALLGMVGAAGAAGAEIDITAKNGRTSVADLSTHSAFRSGYITGFLKGVFLRDKDVQKVCSMSGSILEAYLDTGIQSGAIKPTDDIDF